MAETYGAEIGPLGPAGIENDASLDTDTPMPPDLAQPDRKMSGDDRKQEVGFLPVRVLQPNPLFGDFDKHGVFYQLHGGEVKTAVDGFRVLAESDQCKIQAIAHKDVPLFGTQFHPELYDDDHSDGRRVISNFLSLAGIVS